MKKKIISLILVAVVSSTILISCGKKNTTDSNQGTTTTEQTQDNTNQSGEDAQNNASPNNGETGNSSIVGENNKPTVEVTQIGTISDFKDKNSDAIKSILGNPVSENGSISTYEKDNYIFEITYFDSKCGKIKITPKIEMKYPADGANILNVVGINNPGNPDSTTPGGLEWNNKFDTYKINVASNNEPNGKIEYAEIILAEAYNK